MRTHYWILTGFILSGMLTGLYGQSTLTFVGELPEEIQESSGLLVNGSSLITHNDSGNEAVLYELDSVSLAVIRSVVISGAENTDWEDLAEDADYIYIADIGNNLGTRTDLKVWRVRKTDFAQSNLVASEAINYYYEDQTSFDGGSLSDWDAEALLAIGDSLLIFTKQWQSGGTAVYSIPKTPGTHPARRITAYNSNGLITAAALGPGDTEVYLLGYRGELQPFIIRVPNVGLPFAFGPDTENSSLDLAFSQTEGIAIDSAGKVFVSSERYSDAFFNLPATVYSFLPDPADKGGLDPEGPGPGGEDPPDSTTGLQPGELRIYREPGSPILRYAVGSENAVLARGVYDSAGRLVLYEKAGEMVPGSLDVSGLEAAVYYLTLYLRGETLSEPFLRY